MGEKHRYPGPPRELIRGASIVEILRAQLPHAKSTEELRNWANEVAIMIENDAREIEELRAKLAALEPMVVKLLALSEQAKNVGSNEDMYYVAKELASLV